MSTNSGRYTEEEKAKWRRNGDEGMWEESTDTMEACPEMQTRQEELIIEHCQEHNPELLAFMKKCGLNVDESPTKED